ncbi:MAG: glycosyltransferase family 2 protein [Nitrospirae bacterium]|nr:glycosyltransferase family 2 protein [Nitrospirota bacterium]
MTMLSVLIPVYNAERTIEHLCEKLIGLYLSEFRLEIVLVNDYSTDDTDKICRNLYEKYRDIITYIKLSRNFGEHNALMAGLNHVSGDYCVMMDDDLQNPPEEIGKLIREIQKGYDAVYSVYADKKDSFIRNIGSRFNDRVANVILKKPAALYLSSFKIINRFLINEIIKYTGPDPYIDGIIMRTTDSIGKVPVEHRRRQYNKSGYTLAKLISVWGAMVVNFSLVPLRIVGIWGVALIVIGVFYGGIKAYDDLHTYGKLSEFETLMSANLFFRGFTLIGVSVLGEYVGRIYMSLNRDPQYVIRSIYRSHGKSARVNYIRDVKGKDGQTKYQSEN